VKIPQIVSASEAMHTALGLYNNNNNLTCKAPVCAKKDFS